MENKNGNEPAHTIMTDGRIVRGLTKREYFAGLAMQGLCANPNIKRPSPNETTFENDKNDFAKVCCEYADELLKQLSSK